MTGQIVSNPTGVAFSRWAWFVMHPAACRVQLGCSSCPYPGCKVCPANSGLAELQGMHE